MSSSFVFINIFAISCLIFAFIKDKRKAIQGVVIALRNFIKIIPTILAVILSITLLLAFFSEKQISQIVGDKAGFIGIIIVAFLGSILQIPSLISFPLAASLLKRGASITLIAVFITTLTMVGIITLPLEIKAVGKRIALMRNGISFIIAIIIGIILGMIL